MSQFVHSYFDELPGFYTALSPTPLKGARLLYHSQPLAAELGLSPEMFQPQSVGVWAGESLLPGMKPLAQVYSGHQFGVWAGQLGDGRGILLGEQVTKGGARLDWHLKGAGLTPYSRMGDGRAVLRSTVREFLASEALHGLGIPTTRALTIVASDEPVYRETEERGSMMMRIAPSHVRFGHFEHFFYAGQQEQVRQLLDYTQRHHWPELVDDADRDFLWFKDVAERTGRLIAAWQAVGFSHGVMNTDNMSILGITIDYGPYGFMDDYRANFVCNHSDYQGRYAFYAQPSVAYWNLHRLANALSGVMSVEQLQAGLAAYEPALKEEYGLRMRARLGLFTREEGDSELLNGLLDLMEKEGRDYTSTFRLLSEVEQSGSPMRLRDDFIDRAAFDDWHRRWCERLRREGIDDAQRQASIRAASPRRVLRNYLAQQAIEAAERDDVAPLALLHRGLIDPYLEAKEFESLEAPPSEEGKGIEVSCSS
ncbi:UPF0061 protein [Leminorella grimontii]|uniref:Protein nucleotidyltransferase YdiU n=1 Tax=Leminorella grimontii TaxID=82981 RepID=A0AAV5MVY6_9GAMM|nr:YdiU family protein [Leminorella grimontii]KFC95434.1 selenoprotein O family protein [Leminorella grimontii ATCC 33999 = DSM 5078]GKX53998.1 UPF0061 protein [Leminorella grimontii]VFS60355.1 Uncharacterized conserved protein [Leminorella grimontii]